MNSLYNENHILGRLFKKFMDLFPQTSHIENPNGSLKTVYFKG